MHPLTVPVYAPIWNQMAPRDWSLDYTDDLSVVLNSEFKIAALPALCTLPHHFSYCKEAEQIPFDQFDLVILTDIEYSRSSVIRTWIDQTGIKNYVLAVGGLHMDEQINSNHEVYRPWWCYNLMRLNEFQDTYLDHKPYQFEVLLGARRPHRDYVMLAFQQNNLLDHNVVTYRNVFYGGFEDQLTQQVNERFPEQKLEFPYISPNLKSEWEVRPEITNSISPFVPWDIYRHTNYSVVCETLAGYTEFFMSEKTSKVFFGKRVFVMFANYQFLKNLKSIGFKTFDSVIDETYDNVLDPVTRYAMAFEQVCWLNQQPADQIYSQLQPVLEHNYNHLFELRNQTQQQMRNLLQLHIPQKFWI